MCATNRKIILASKSPRRLELLKQIVDEFEVEAATKPEKKPFYIKGVKVPQYLAKQKALEIYKKHKDALVIGADTVVILNKQILGKPKDKNDVRRMITTLSGHTHIVVTGVYIICKEYKKSFSTTTKVTFKKMTEKEIEDYCKLTTVYDKAGAYAIQGEAKDFITKIDGDYNNVVGLPINELKENLI